MNLSPTSLFRYTKRALLTNGYSKPVHKYLRRVATTTEQGIAPTDGTYTVNLSFDFELSVTTYFWNGDFHNTKRVGELGLNNLFPTIAHLKEKGLPFNIQIVGGLLDPNICNYPLFTDAQKDFIKKHPTLFTLPEQLIPLLHEKSVEVGIHGFSHRMFTTISREEAKIELEKATSLFKSQLPNLPQPTFMAYPRNHFAHTDLLPSYGISTWRSGRLTPSATGEIPLGVWFAPGNLNPSELERCLTHLRKTHPGYFLHLWNHFTEMDPKTFEKMIHVIQNSGWEFTNVRDFMKKYG